MFSGASFTSAFCFHLGHGLAEARANRGLPPPNNHARWSAYHPKAIRPIWNPQNKKWKISLLAVNCFFTSVPKLSPPLILTSSYLSNLILIIKNVSTCDSSGGILRLTTWASTDNSGFDSERTSEGLSERRCVYEVDGKYVRFRGWQFSFPLALSFPLYLLRPGIFINETY